MEDFETGELIAIDTGSEAVRTWYRREVARQISARDALFKRLGLDFVSVVTGTPYITPLVEFFRRRARRMRFG